MEGKYTGIRYVHAKGKIEAKVWYTKNQKVYFKQIKKEETGEQENKYGIKINNFEINFFICDNLHTSYFLLCHS